MTNGSDKRAGRFKTELDRTGIDKEGSLEWQRRGAMNWEGERVIINAQEHHTDAFKKMSGSMDITNKALRPDIVPKHKNEKSAFVIEVSVPNDFGRHATELRKMTKYQVL